MPRPSKQQIASVRSALREIHAELLAWDPHVLVSFNSEAEKAQIVARMGRLGWHYVDDPSNETADVSMVEFSLDPISLSTTASPARPDRGKLRRVRPLDRPFLVFGIISALMGILLTGVVLSADYRMKSLKRDGTVTTGEIERTYFTSRRDGCTYCVAYQFVDAHWTSHKGEDSYPFQDWRSLRPGTPISVTYLADDPKRNNLTRNVLVITGRNRQKWEMIWLSIPWVVSGCFFFGFWACRRRLKDVSFITASAGAATTIAPDARAPSFRSPR